MRPNASMDLIRPKPPGTPSMATLAKREESFKDWPVGMDHIDTKTIASAGFFYTGLSDRVECYHCEQMVGDWLVEKDPWTAHVEKSPNCFHLKLVKGPEFIRAVEAKQKSAELKNKLFKEMPFGNIEEVQVEPNQTIDNTEDMTCKICLINKIQLVLLPCGHLCSCRECAVSSDSKCPICKKSIEAYIGVYYT